MTEFERMAKANEDLVVEQKKLVAGQDKWIEKFDAWYASDIERTRQYRNALWLYTGAAVVQALLTLVAVACRLML